MSKYVAFPRLTPFNREDEFIFRRKTKVQGKWYDDQDRVPKDAFTTRRLRQLFEGRVIQSIGIIQEEDDAKERPEFKALPTAAIKDFLKTNGVTPRSNWMRAKLIERADALWEEINGIPAPEPDQEPS